jgi:hypothetical protein
MNLIKEIISSHGRESERGIPLGNLTSQLFANVYLHELDWYVKHTLRKLHYIRYCDDFIILSEDRVHLLGLVPVLANFLTAHLKLTIHPDKILIRTWEQGVDFLGYVIKPTCILLRTKTKNRMLKQIGLHNLTSYMGVCSHAASYEVQQLIQNKVQCEWMSFENL